MAKPDNSTETRTTIALMPCLLERVNNLCKYSEENFSDFYNRAVLNELERMGDFEIRYIVEEEAAKKESEIKWL